MVKYLGHLLVFTTLCACARTNNFKPKTAAATLIISKLPGATLAQATEPGWFQSFFNQGVHAEDGSQEGGGGRYRSSYGQSHGVTDDSLSRGGGSGGFKQGRSSSGYRRGTQEQDGKSKFVFANSELEPTTLFGPGDFGFSFKGFKDGYFPSEFDKGGLSYGDYGQKGSYSSITLNQDGGSGRDQPYYVHEDIGSYGRGELEQKDSYGQGGYSKEQTVNPKSTYDQDYVTHKGFFSDGSYRSANKDYGQGSQSGSVVGFEVKALPSHLYSKDNLGRQSYSRKYVASEGYSGQKQPDQSYEYGDSQKNVYSYPKEVYVRGGQDQKTTLGHSGSYRRPSYSSSDRGPRVSTGYHRDGSSHTYYDQKSSPSRTLASGLSSTYNIKDYTYPFTKGWK